MSAAAVFVPVFLFGNLMILFLFIRSLFHWHGGWSEESLSIHHCLHLQMMFDKLHALPSDLPPFDWFFPFFAFFYSCCNQWWSRLIVLSSSVIIAQQKSPSFGWEIALLAHLYFLLFLVFSESFDKIDHFNLASKLKCHVVSDARSLPCPRFS
jgi:hypothetical protein